MSPKKFILTTLVALCAMWLLFANAAIAAECLPPSCAADENPSGGVPDGNFANDAATAVSPTPKTPPPAVTSADGPGSAVFSPFASVQDRRKHTPPPLNSRSAAIAIALAIAVIVTLAGVAAFSFFVRHDGKK